jgi:dienelactone hydrolase
MKSGWLALCCLVMLLVSPVTRGATAGPVGEQVGPWREQIHWVPMRDAVGVEHLLYTRVCRPQTEDRARVVLINHGSPPDPSARATMQPSNCASETVAWFLRHGFVVVLGMRRGYGATRGAWAEGFGNCSADGYARAGLESARDVAALVAYATALPFARADGVVVVGHSAGGWATDAYDSQPHPQVVAMVSMAGGRGGHYKMQANNNCQLGELIRAAGVYGRTATTPMLWVYAENDSFFSPAMASAMYKAFTEAGGKAELIQTGAFGSDGHSLFTGRNGSPIWGPMIERYLAERGVSVR